MLRFSGLSLSILLAGCGLTLDYDPPDPQPGYDGGRMDAGTGGADGGGSSDAGPSDGGAPLDCVEDIDCDDDDACTGIEQCVEGACVPGEAIACPDDDVCDGVDACVAGECVSTGAVTCPDDGNPCNGSELCDAVLGCTATPPPPCDDGVECTVDTCDPTEGCVSTPDAELCPEGPGRRCDPEAGCQYEVCDASTCVPTGCTDAHCSGSVCVRTSLCDFATFCCAGTCVLPGCDDGNPCTADACDPALGCSHVVMVGAPCDDEDRCTTAEQCLSDGSCGGGARVSCSDGDPCTTDSCDPSIGCRTSPAPDGTMCTDRNACTTYDRCESGVCVPGASRLCAVGIRDADCLTARCDPVLGCVLEPVPAGSPCTSGGSTAFCDGAGNCCGSSHDCDGDGICECPAGTTCGFAGGCPGSDCATASDCGMGESCCGGGTGTGTDRRGYCYPTNCLGCCMPVVVTP